MKKTINFFIFIFSLFLVSCDKNNDLDNQSTTKISIDSIYFSCKIDNQPIEFKSPGIKGGSWSESAKRLKKVKNSTKDSILVTYTKGFINEHYIIEIGFSESILLEIDTINQLANMPNQKSILLRKGIHSIQFLEDIYGLNVSAPMHCGFSITITDINKQVTYSSYIKNEDPNISTEYYDFVSKSSFEITELTRINTSVYNDYINAWFFTSKFHCKLYKNSSSTEPAILTDGVINCCF